jgi:hypothetical protein
MKRKKAESEELLAAIADAVDDGPVSYLVRRVARDEPTIKGAKWRI